MKQVPLLVLLQSIAIPLAILIIDAIIVLYLLVKLYVAYSGIIMGNGFIESLKMSWNYTKGNWLKTFGVMLIINIIEYLANMAYLMASFYIISLEPILRDIVLIIISPTLYLYALLYIPVAILYLRYKSNFEQNVTAEA